MPCAIILIVIGMLFASPMRAGEPWPGLSVLKVDRTCSNTIRIRYKPELTTVINCTFTDPESKMKTVEAVEARVSAGSAPLLIEYSEGPSCDPTFFVYRCMDHRKTGEPLLTVWGLTLAIPGDGFIYVYGHTNNFYSQMRKFEATQTGVREVPQPFFFVGLKTKTTVGLDLLSSPDAGVVVSRLEKGERATVLACKADDWCLVKDRIGVVGWFKLEYTEKGNGQFLGVFFAGD